MARRPVLLPLLAGLALASTGCGSDGATGVGGPPEVDRILVSPAEPRVDAGDSVTVTASVLDPSGGDVTDSVAVRWTVRPASAAELLPAGPRVRIVGLEPGAAVVEARVAGVVGTASLTVADTTPPRAPSAVTAVPASDRAVEVSWADNSDNEEEFRIDRAEAASGGGVAGRSDDFAEVGRVPADETRFRDEGVEPATRYLYRVRACNRNGCVPGNGGGEPGGAGSVSEPVESEPTLVLGTDGLASGVRGVAYADTLRAEGGNGDYAWSLPAGDLPAGLTLDPATGIVAGTPSTAGTFPVTVRVASNEQVVEADLAVEIADTPPPLQPDEAALPAGVRDRPYEARLGAEGGTGAYTWSLASGALPPGLTLDPDGWIRGTPAEAGRWSGVLRVASGTQTATRDFVLPVWEPLTVDPALPPAVVGADYAGALAVRGGDPPIRVELADGSLPLGLDLGETGTLAGIPEEAGRFAFSVRATSADGQEVTAGAELEVHPPLEIVTTRLPDAEVGLTYRVALEARGGDGSYAWEPAPDSPPLPPRLELSTEGLLVGILSTGGSYTIGVQVTSGDGQLRQRELTLHVRAPVEVVTTALPDGSVGVPYGATLQASGGDGNYAWDLPDGPGSLPPGLELSRSGTVRGTPEAGGTFQLRVRVSSFGETSTADVELFIASTPLALEPHVLPVAHPGSPYDAALRITGGGSDPTVRILEGALPPGLSLSGGRITGTPSSPGVHVFRVEASDPTTTVSALFTVTVSSNPASGFNLHLHWVADGLPSSTVTEALEDAAARYERIVTSDAPDVTLPDAVSSASCRGSLPLARGAEVDDILVFVGVESFDGSGNLLGLGGFCGFVRSAPDPATVTGFMALDGADLGISRSLMKALVIHEVGHALGIGVAWDCPSCDYDLIDGNDGVGGAVPTYTGAAGVAEYNVLLSAAGDEESSTVPVENGFADTNADFHWDEGAFDTELMTGILEGGGREALSRVTVGALEDLRWSVSYAEADAYSLPGCRPGCSAAPGLPGSEGVPLGNDVRVEPVQPLPPRATLRSAPGGAPPPRRAGGRRR